MRYYDLMRNSKDPKVLRHRIAIYAIQNGNKAAAKYFKTSTHTVRKWRGRFELHGYKGLEEESRAPHNPKRYITKELRQEVITLKKKMPAIGALRLKNQFNLAISPKAIGKIYREEGLLKKKRKKHKTKNDLRAIKQQMRIGQQIDVDTKYLRDIPEFLQQTQYVDLPEWQYTARDVVSGLMIIGYAKERSLIHATLFIQIVTAWLQQAGLKLAGSQIQTDNGGEFIGAYNAKEDSIFTKAVEMVDGLKHQTIPPAAHTWQSDVETVHRLIEDEFLEVETFKSRQAFFDKASTYNLWFNSVRKNSYKGWRTPAQIIKERDPTIDPSIAQIPALDLDKFLRIWMKEVDRGGTMLLLIPIR